MVWEIEREQLNVHCAWDDHGLAWQNVHLFNVFLAREVKPCWTRKKENIKRWKTVKKEYSDSYSWMKNMKANIVFRDL